MRKFKVFVQKSAVVFFFAGLFLAVALTYSFFVTTSTVRERATNVEWTVWAAERLAFEAWMQRGKEWRAKADRGWLEFAQWQRDILGGRPTFDACALTDGEKAELEYSGDPRARQCAHQRYLSAIRVQWMSRIGTTEERVASILDELLLEGGQASAEARAHWYRFMPTEVVCSGGRCTFSRSHSILNDRVLVGKVLERDPSVQLVAPNDAEWISAFPGSPGPAPVRDVMVERTVPVEPLPSWMNYALVVCLLLLGVLLNTFSFILSWATGGSYDRQQPQP